MCIFNKGVDSLQQWKKVQDREPTTGTIIYWYIKIKGIKLCQEALHLPKEICSAAKVQDNIGWDNMIRCWIDHPREK